MTTEEQREIDRDNMFEEFRQRQEQARLSGTERYELDRQAAFGDCEAEFWGICNSHKTDSDPDSIFNPEADNCKRCQIWQQEHAETEPQTDTPQTGDAKTTTTETKD